MKARRRWAIVGGVVAAAGCAWLLYAYGPGSRERALHRDVSAFLSAPAASPRGERIGQVLAYVLIHRERWPEAEGLLRRIDPEWPQSPEAIALVPEIIDRITVYGQGGPGSAGVEILVRLGAATRSAVPTLVERLADRNPEARRRSADLLAQIDPDWAKSPAARSRIPTLAKHLTPLGDDGVRRAAEQTLRAIDTEWAKSDEMLDLVPELLDRLTTVSPWVGDQELLEGIPIWSKSKQARGHISKLIAGLAHPDQRIVSASAAWLGRIDPQWPTSAAAGEAVARLLDASTRRGDAAAGAAAALEQVPGWQRLEATSKAAAALMPRLGDADCDPAALARVLDQVTPGWLKSPAALATVPALIARVESEQDGGPTVGLLDRLAADWAESAAGRALLGRLTKQLGDAAAAEQAARALGALGSRAGSAAPALVALLPGYGKSRRAAADALERIDPDWPRSAEAKAALKTLMAELERRDTGAYLDVTPEIRKNPDVKQVVDKFNKFATVAYDQDLGGRQTAIWAVGRIHAAGEGADASAVVPHLIRHLTDHRISIANEAEKTLDKIAPKWAESREAKQELPALIAALKAWIDRDENARKSDAGDRRPRLLRVDPTVKAELLRTVRLLASIGPGAAKGELNRLLEHPDDEISGAALIALRSGR